MGIAAAASQAHPYQWVLLWVPAQRCHIKKKLGGDRERPMNSKRK